ncbi:MAG: 16S rRNA (guanine(966)-N(2))-methyltransferase RsmD [Candidatus Omnitrophica bacterium]|nr:16S rRNA (guanine(966)-N(2))-methyltransferase RsmD [Candidatus Omnitrophota bacterium]
MDRGLWTNEELVNMRIISGKYKGRKINFPKSPYIRPTQDRVREALFNVLARSISGVNALDLFAGSGAFGIEALSRGAKNVTFVDNNFKCVRIIKENLRNIDIEDRANILRMDALRAIKKLSKTGNKFDIVFLDPPYYKGLSKKTLISLNQYDILSHTNIIVAEHFKKDILPYNIDNMIFFKQKRFGDTVLSFYRKK